MVSGFGFLISDFSPVTVDLEFSPGGFGFWISDFGRDLLEFSPIRILLKKIETFDLEGQFNLCGQIVIFGGPARKV